MFLDKTFKAQQRYYTINKRKEKNRRLVKYLRISRPEEGRKGAKLKYTQPRGERVTCDQEGGG